MNSPKILKKATTKETDVWSQTDPEDLWVMDKLIIARMMGYNCGPAGIDVPKPDTYIVRPCVNACGMGYGTFRDWIECDTEHLPPGTFWCEIFEGRHLSVDYLWGKQMLAVEGVGCQIQDGLAYFDHWVKVDDEIVLPDFLKDLAFKYGTMNCEFIGGKLIEVHLRANPDWEHRAFQTIYIPVFEGQDTTPPQGFDYIQDPEPVAQRIGAFVK